MTESRELTPAQKIAAKHLRRIWEEKKRRLDLTQSRAGERLGMSQGAVGHYLAGRRGLNPQMVLQFARLLQEMPDSIWPGFSEEYGLGTPGEKVAEIEEIVSPAIVPDPNLRKLLEELIVEASKEKAERDKVEAAIRLVLLLLR